VSLLEIAKRVEAEILAKQQARGITVDDVLRVFPGARIVSGLPCRCCGHKMIERVKGRQYVLWCARCGRKK